MPSPIMDWLLMKELIHPEKKDDFLSTVRQYEEWMKKKDEEKKKEDADKKAKEKPKPPTFSVMQVFLILTGLGPFVGLVAARFQIELVQSVLDALRTIH